MNKYDALRKKLVERKKILGTTMSTFDSPIILEKMNRDDLDFLLFDAEHGIFNNENLIPSLQVCRLMGLPSFVRVPVCEYHFIARAIDLGADGIMLPRTETAEQVKDAIDALRFAPIGKTGCGGHGQFKTGEGFDGFQESRFLLVQIESQAGIDILPQILETYGDEIAAIMVGPYDMSIMYGVPFQIESDVTCKGIQKVFDICRQYGKSCGIFCDDERLAKKYRKMGANLLWACLDHTLFLRAYHQVFDSLAKME